MIREYRKGRRGGINKRERVELSLKEGSDDLGGVDSYELVIENLLENEGGLKHVEGSRVE